MSIAVSPQSRHAQLSPEVQRRAWLAGAAVGAFAVLVLIRELLFDSTAEEWFATLRRPSWAGATPVLLGVGWVLVAATAVGAAWIVAVRRSDSTIAAAVCWAIEIALVLAWMWFVFYNGNLLRGFAAAVVLVVASTLTVVAFTRVSRVAGALMVPAVAWSSMVALVTGGLVFLN